VLHSVHTSSGAQPASYPGNRLECEADRSSPSSTEVKPDGTIPQLSHTSSWHNALLIKHDDNFAFFYFTFFRNVGVKAQEGTTKRKQQA
jgi:hypothetical protein